MLLGFHPLIGTQGGVMHAFKKASLVKWLKTEKALSITRSNLSELNLFSITAFFPLKQSYTVGTILRASIDVNLFIVLENRNRAIKKIKPSLQL